MGVSEQVSPKAIRKLIYFHLQLHSMEIYSANIDLYPVKQNLCGSPINELGAFIRRSLNLEPWHLGFRRIPDK